MPKSNQKVVVELSASQRKHLEQVWRSQSEPISKVRRARVLLLADEDRTQGHRPDWYIAEELGISERHISRIRKQFAGNGMETTIARKKRSDAETSKTFDGTAEAKLVTLCCSDPPKGQQRWTLKLLADELCRLKIVASVCPETVRRSLKKTGSSLG